MTLSEGYYWFKAADEEWEVCRIITIRDSLCAFFFFGRNTPIPINELQGEWVRIEPPEAPLIVEERQTDDCTTGGMQYKHDGQIKNES